MITRWDSLGVYTLRTNCKILSPENTQINIFTDSDLMTVSEFQLMEGKKNLVLNNLVLTPMPVKTIKC